MVVVLAVAGLVVVWGAAVLRASLRTTAAQIDAVIAALEAEVARQ
jgi:ABC-type phosphate transport system auxiliary subunit